MQENEKVGDAAKNAEPSPLMGIILDPPKTPFEIVKGIVENCVGLCGGMDSESARMSIMSCLYGIEKLSYALGREDIEAEAQAAIGAMRSRL